MGPWYMPIKGETGTSLPLPLGLAEDVETETVKHPTKGVGYCLFRAYAVHSQDDCQVVFENTLLSSLLFY